MTPRTLYLLVLVFIKLVKRYGVINVAKAILTSTREPPVVNQRDEKYYLFR
jgi:hypothetical protein